MKISKPRRSPFYRHCYQCEWWTFDRQVGAAIIGICSALPDDPDERDAYEGACGLWGRRNGGKR